jgi:hypothetical protein
MLTLLNLIKPEEITPGTTLAIPVHVMVQTQGGLCVSMYPFQDMVHIGEYLVNFTVPATYIPSQQTVEILDEKIQRLNDNYNNRVQELREQKAKLLAAKNPIQKDEP